jgi:outer membrane protein OmpA-like peptidoglycan-associated protein
MFSRTTRGLLIVGLAALPFAAAHAGPFDSAKKKLEEKAGKKTDEAMDKATDSKAAAGGGQTAATGRDTTASGSPAKISSVSTKFDFVPGDKVLFFDDFTQDELGEFPARWKLGQGTFEVVEADKERWLRLASADGRIRMKLPASGPLPEFWTLEFDFLGEEPMASALTVRGMGNGDHPAWEAVFPQGQSMAFRTGEVFSTTPYEDGPSVAGRHHVMFMARGTALKAYIDRQRMVSVPEVSAAAGPVSDIEIRLWASTKPMITKVRFAEGCKPADDLLAAGKLVTYGIHFPSGSDVVQPESAPILRQIAAYLGTNPAVKLQITGHTDNVGTPASNLDLSKRRAESVARVLADQFQVAPERFTTDGKGDTQALAGNEKPEGRAMNRRVEFTKL